MSESEGENRRGEGYEKNDNERVKRENKEKVRWRVRMRRPPGRATEGKTAKTRIPTDRERRRTSSLKSAYFFAK